MTTLTEIKNIEVADFCERGSTISVTASANGSTETFHVQTVDGEYRSSLGCWITTDTESESIDYDDYPDFCIDTVIDKAEKFAESNLGDKEENKNYFNKDSSPYTKRFLNN